MSCCSAPGVVFISLWQISECTSPSNPLLSHCSFSLSHSVLECLQKASLLEHSFPDLNPTSDCFILHEYWNSPLFQLICLYKLAKTSDETSLRISVLFPHAIFRLHFKNYLYLISSRMTSLMTRDFFYPCLSPHSLSPEARCSLKMKGGVSLWPSLSHLSLPERLPFLIKGSLNAALALPSSFMPSLSQKHFARVYPWFYFSHINLKWLSEFIKSPSLICRSASFVLLSLKNFIFFSTCSQLIFKILLIHSIWRISQKGVAVCSPCDRSTLLIQHFCSWLIFHSQN